MLGHVRFVGHVIGSLTRKVFFADGAVVFLAEFRADFSFAFSHRLVVLPATPVEFPAFENRCGRLRDTWFPVLVLRGKLVAVIAAVGNADFHCRRTGFVPIT